MSVVTYNPSSSRHDVRRRLQQDDPIGSQLLSSTILQYDDKSSTPQQYMSFVFHKSLIRMGHFLLGWE